MLKKTSIILIVTVFLFTTGCSSARQPVAATVNEGGMEIDRGESPAEVTAGAVNSYAGSIATVAFGVGIALWLVTCAKTGNCND